jgi:hypothetical protein
MPPPHFHVYFFASILGKYTYGREKLTAASASSDVEVYLFQVAAYFQCLALTAILRHNRFMC